MEKTQLTYQAKLKALKDLRIFTNTSRDWDQRYGNPVEEEDCKLLYLSLHKLAEEHYGIDLDELMEDYLKSSKIYDGVFHKRKRTTVWTVEIVEAFVKGMFQQDIDFDFLKNLVGEKYFDDFFHADPILLLGWVHQKFPFFDAKSGDVSTETNKQNMEFFANRLRSFYPDHMSNETSPLLDMLFRKLYSASEVVRIDVYHFIDYVLGNVGVMTSREITHDIYHHIEWLDMPGINLEDGVVWKDENNEEYWAFSSTKNNTLSLIRYILPKKEFIAYPISFMADSLDPCKMYVNDYDYIEGLCYNRAYLPNTKAFYHVDQTDDALFSKYLTGGLKIVPFKLSKVELVPSLEKELSACGNKYPRYAFSRRLLQILYAEDYLFVECTLKSVGAELQVVDSWFRIPKDSMFSELRPDDPIRLYCWNDKLFLLFESLELSIDISNREELAKYQITIVPYPTVFVARQDADVVTMKGGEWMDSGSDKVVVRSQAKVWKNEEECSSYQITESFEKSQTDSEEPVVSHCTYRVTLEDVN